MWIESRSYWSLPLTSLFGKFHHFYNSYLLAGTAVNKFLVENRVNIAHLPVIAKRYNIPMRRFDRAFTTNILVSYDIFVN